MFVFHLFLSSICLGNFAESCFFSFWSAQNQKTNNNNDSPESGGQRGWELGFPALHRHHSGTGRKDTQNGKRCGKKRFMFLDRYEIHFQAFVKLINGNESCSIPIFVFSCFRRKQKRNKEKQETTK